jgi:hypothetical protein
VRAMVFDGENRSYTSLELRGSKIMSLEFGIFGKATKCLCLKSASGLDRLVCKRFLKRDRYATKTRSGQQKATKHDPTCAALSQ